ncbi:hypothetical protein LINPERPRIM_LOCUS33456 [Linum perenne]
MRYVPSLLEQLRKNTPDYATNSDIKYRLKYPQQNAMVYASSFCKKSSASECGHCLKLASKKLLHQCAYSLGAQVYSELCFMRYELYDFFTT